MNVRRLSCLNTMTYELIRFVNLYVKFNNQKIDNSKDYLFFYVLILKSNVSVSIKA